MNYLGIFAWALYPSDVGAYLGLACYLVIIAFVVALLVKHWNLAKILGAYFLAFLATWGTRNNEYMVQGTNHVFEDQMVRASGFPFTMFTDDAGMTDWFAHEWAVVANFIIFFAIALLILRPNFKKLWK